MFNVPLNILFTMYRSFGDIVMSTAVLRALKQKYPKSNIVYQTSSNCLDLLMGNPDLSGIGTERDYIEAMNYDMVFSPFMITQSRPDWWQYKTNMMDLYASICGVELKNRQCYIYPVNIDHLKSQYDIPKEYIAIQCKTHDVTKDYTRFPELVKLINEKLKIPVIQIGGLHDPKIEGVFLNLCNKISFRESATLVKEAKNTVCLDSAVAHIAGAVGGKRIILYGATNFELCGSGSKENTVILEPEVRLPDCKESCFKASCPIKNCINSIEPEDILKFI
jgi:ADP-heptose:LPS heptosyltransferase